MKSPNILSEVAKNYMLLDITKKSRIIDGHNS